MDIYAVYPNMVIHGDDQAFLAVNDPLSRSDSSVQD